MAVHGLKSAQTGGKSKAQPKAGAVLIYFTE